MRAQTAGTPGSRGAREIAASLIGLALLLLGACDRPVVPALPAQPIVAFSASPFAIDVIFARPLDRASASIASHYAVASSADGRLIPVRVAWVDTLFGETVRLLFGLGTLKDSTRYQLTVMGVLDAWGRPQFAADSASIEIRTGLGYAYPIQPLLERKCTPCHAGGRPGGEYRTDSYEALFGDGSDASSSNPTPNIVPGDARSLLVIRTSPRHSMFNVAHLSYIESQLFANWVATYQARR